jgi:lipopolysaccharide/colanic/teichoic acid biosynthesis glycosyltransferase
LLTVIAIAVWCSSRGPALFRHTRVGRDGRAIRVTKFRTMVPDAVERLERDLDLQRRYIDGGFKLQTDDDPRITRLGRVLRRASLDELPQLWDVLVGRMSIVGPRPVMPAELSSYGPYVGAYLAVKPGITGLWQVTGRSDVGFPERGRIDYFYASRWTLWFDVKVLLRTVPAVLARRGAY